MEMSVHEKVRALEEHHARLITLHNDGLKRFRLELEMLIVGFGIFTVGLGLWSMHKINVVNETLTNVVKDVRDNHDKIIVLEERVKRVEKRLGD
jgi:hypothetical protein